MNISNSAAYRYLCTLLITLTLNTVLLWQPVAAQDAGLSESGLSIANAVNQVRIEHGLEPLAVHPLLTQAAQGHVNDMLTNYIYGHYGSDGSSVHMRVARTGYSDTPWVSENWVSAGSTAGAMRWWMNDYIHRVNILTPRWREVGIGVGQRGSEMIFVTVFSAGEGAVGEAVVLDAPVDPPSVRIDPESVPAEGLEYSIRPGDTLLAIGLRFGMPWETIAEVNGMDERSLLQIGDILHIPGVGGVGGPAEVAATVPDVPTEPYSVQPGDTLFTLAAQRGLSWQELAALNQMNESSILQIDQTIYVPANTDLASSEPTTSDQTTDSQAAEAAGENESVVEAATAPEQAESDVVLAAEDGSTTGEATQEASIAESSAASSEPAEVDELSAALAAVPVTAPSEFEQDASIASVASVEEEAGEFYTIDAGDTILSIAVEQGLDWQQLMSLNGLTEDSLVQPGQSIRLR